MRNFYLVLIYLAISILWCRKKYLLLTKWYHIFKHSLVHNILEINSYFCLLYRKMEVRRKREVGKVLIYISFAVNGKRKILTYVFDIYSWCKFIWIRLIRKKLGLFISLVIECYLGIFNWPIITFKRLNSPLQICFLTSLSN